MCDIDQEQSLNYNRFMVILIPLNKWSFLLDIKVLFGVDVCFQLSVELSRKTHYKAFLDIINVECGALGKRH